MRKGFTLIELSIVLVIIGLIAGGVLVGSDLILAATIRATISQVEKFDTAANTFRIKYNCLPGDCDKAVEFGFATSGGAGDDGNNNKVITGTFIAPLTTSHEGYNFWYHLQLANMIEGGNYPGSYYLAPEYDPTLPGVHFPKAKIANTGIWVSQGLFQWAGLGTSLTNTNYFWILQKMINTGTVSIRFVGALKPIENYMIDSKTDDGFPLTGVVGLSHYYHNGLDVILDEVSGMALGVYGPGGSNANYCANSDPDPPTYNTQNVSGHPNTRCMLYIRATFQP